MLTVLVFVVQVVALIAAGLACAVCTFALVILWDERPRGSRVARLAYALREGIDMLASVVRA